MNDDDFNKWLNSYVKFLVIVSTILMILFCFDLICSILKAFVAL